MNSGIEETLSLQLQFDKRGGLLPVVVQEAMTKEVLMLGYANEAAVKKTIQSGYASFWSTSRNELWTKGMTSGDTLKMEEIRVDCDQDALLYIVSLDGKGVCHTKDEQGHTRKACFYRRLRKEQQLEFLG